MRFGVQLMQLFKQALEMNKQWDVNKHPIILIKIRDTILRYTGCEIRFKFNPVDNLGVAIMLDDILVEGCNETFTEVLESVQGKYIGGPLDFNITSAMANDFNGVMLLKTSGRVNAKPVMTICSDEEKLIVEDFIVEVEYDE